MEDIEQKQAEIIDLLVKRASTCKDEALVSIIIEATSLREPKFRELLGESKLREPNRKLRMNSSERSSVCAQQKIEIPNRQNEKLVGLLHETGSREIVVLCHGFKSNKNSKIIMNHASSLEKEGISAFRFDFSGNGESEGSFNYGNYSYEADDLHSVIQHFTSKNRVVTTILGHSRGGNVVLLYASKYHICNVINISGRYDLKKGIRLGDGYLERIKQQGFVDDAKEGKPVFRVTEKSLMERLNTNMHEACLKIGKDCNVLIVHGSKDKIVPVADANEFAKIIPNHELEIFKGADHGYTKHESQLVSRVIKFLKRVASRKPKFCVPGSTTLVCSWHLE